MWPKKYLKCLKIVLFDIKVNLYSVLVFLEFMSRGYSLGGYCPGGNIRGGLVQGVLSRGMVQGSFVQWKLACFPHENLDAHISCRRKAPDSFDNSLLNLSTSDDDSRLNDQVRPSSFNVQFHLFLRISRTIPLTPLNDQVRLSSFNVQFRLFLWISRTISFTRLNDQVMKKLRCCSIIFLSRMVVNR